MKVTGPNMTGDAWEAEQHLSQLSPERFVNSWAGFHQFHSWWQLLHFMQEASCVANMLLPGGKPGE